MAIKLYDLAGQDDQLRFSPTCWRAKMALAHKGLEVDSLPWRFTEKDQLPEGCVGRVPAIVDGETLVHDSWEIALYLDKTYPDKPLFSGPDAMGTTRLIQEYWNRQIHPAVAKTILKDLFAVIAEKDKPYFRESREKVFGKSIEAVSEDVDGNIASLRAALEPFRAVIGGRAFLGGDQPAYADYVCFGAFAWARASSPIKLLAEDDPVYAWRARMMDLHGGLARNAPGNPV